MRDFFEQQDAARGRSRRFAAILAAAILGTIVATAIVLAGLTTLLAMLQVSATTNIRMSDAYWYGLFAHQLWLLMAAVAVVVICASVFRTMKALESGGLEVARQMGGTRVLTFGGEPEYQQLINVVEELSIAAGTHAPKIFVLKDEKGINAFAAGIDPKDMAVAVTRGALEHLTRSQLQGVLAHEFSHIVNGDVRINVQALGALQGIEAVASAARFLIRLGTSSGMKYSWLATAFGCVLWPVGQIGVLFGSLARMALNRQREFLADAAAVQFTRDPDGLASALKLIAAQAVPGRMESSAARSARHLFFAEDRPALGRLLASHPPIELRIQRLDPAWDGRLPTSLPADATCLGSAETDRRHAEAGCDELDAAVLNTLADIAADARTVLPSSPAAPSDFRDVCATRTGGLAEGGGIAVAEEKLVRSEGRIASPSYETADQEGSPACQSNLSEAEKQACLEAIAQSMAEPSRRPYDPQVTHWPTLAATAAALVIAYMIFSWWTS